MKACHRRTNPAYLEEYETVKLLQAENRMVLPGAWGRGGANGELLFSKYDLAIRPDAKVPDLLSTQYLWLTALHCMLKKSIMWSS